MLDSSVLIAAELPKLTAAQAIETSNLIGKAPVVLSAVTVAEIGHGIYCRNTWKIRHRAPVDDLKATVLIFPPTESTAGTIATHRRQDLSAGPHHARKRAAASVPPDDR